MSAGVTLTKKFEFRHLKEHLKLKFEGCFTSNFKVPFKIEIEITFQKSNVKGYLEIEL